MTIALTKHFSNAVAIAGLMMLPFNISAATFTGRLNGYICAHKGKSCPVDRLDPHIALEQDFVLVTEGGDYYFLPNLGRDTNVRYVLQDVQVKRDKLQRYNSIQVSEFQIKKEGVGRRYGRHSCSAMNGKPVRAAEISSVIVLPTFLTYT